MRQSARRSGGLRCARLIAQGAGFTYISLLIFIVIMGVFLALAGETWHLAMRREKEKELLFVGEQFRHALDQYVGSATPGAARFPLSLEDLLKDPRYPGTRRYLRKIYRDPLTGSENWGVVRGPGGEIYGVYSLSEAEPLKKHNFSVLNSSFEDKLKYTDWVFMSTSMRYGARTAKRP